MEPQKQAKKNNRKNRKYHIPGRFVIFNRLAAVFEKAITTSTEIQMENMSNIHFSYPFEQFGKKNYCSLVSARISDMAICLLAQCSSAESTCAFQAMRKTCRKWAAFTFIGGM